jgi:hypothetical protein
MLRRKGLEERSEPLRQLEKTAPNKPVDLADDTFKEAVEDPITAKKSYPIIADTNKKPG